MRGVFLDTDTIDGGDLDMSPITGVENISWNFYGTTGADTVAERIAACEIVLCNKVVLDRETLAGAGRLRLIIIVATGTNNVDLDAAQDHDITVCNVRAYGTASVVQHVYALILALTTRLPQYIRVIAQDKWQQHPHFCLFDFPIRELAGKVLGVVGYGTLGKGVADAARAFGLEVKIAQRPGGTPEPSRVPLDQLLPAVDVLSLHCPLTIHTRDLIGAAELAAMKDDAILINTARGGIVNERALADALRQGSLGGAGIDVLTQEPPATGNILLDPSIPNLIVTPHIAWASRESRQRVIDITVENIRDYLAGKPRNVVTSGD